MIASVSDLASCSVAECNWACFRISARNTYNNRDKCENDSNIMGNKDGAGRERGHGEGEHEEGERWERRDRT
jgi:hypothetical protein